ncbi:MAG: SpoIVB peptidase [Clostridia bacterium]|nr:SpoIVB peptidase [Clostridia bacterium]
MNRKNIKTWVLLLTVALLIGGSILSASAAPQAAEGGQLPQTVCVGGMPFGVKFYTEGILVVGFCDVDVNSAGGGCRSVNPARDAGLKLRDVIVGVNGEKPLCAATLTQAVEESGGSPITLTVKRCAASVSKRQGNNTPKTTELNITVTPVKSASENRYKTGLWVRDSGAGIGTVTFIMPDTGDFGGLGHGICDGDTGELIPMQRGQVTDVTVSGIEKSTAGDPGAIKGYFAPGKTGSLLKNTECGVYGIFAQRPSSEIKRVPVGRKEEMKEGDASLLCTLDSGHVGEYKVKITAIDRSATGSKCFTLTVTDPALIEKTGGIVQGMSGSPIVQNGKLVGAVTHVLINDPTTGYGIFIENMLNAAQTPMTKAS